MRPYSYDQAINYPGLFPPYVAPNANSAGRTGSNAGGALGGGFVNFLPGFMRPGWNPQTHRVEPVRPSNEQARRFLMMDFQNERDPARRARLASFLGIGGTNQPMVPMAAVSPYRPMQKVLSPPGMGPSRPTQMPYADWQANRRGMIV